MQSWLETDATASSQASEINPRRRLRFHKAEPGGYRVEQEIPRDPAMLDTRLYRQFSRLVTGKDRWPLYLYGEPGRGKTMACLCLCDIVANARYYTPSRLMDICSQKRVWLPWGVEGRRYMQIDLAILDEVGAGNVNDFHYQMVKGFADDRELRHHRVAVYVSNLPPDAIRGKYDDRIASRILCGTLYELTGVDRRKTQATDNTERKVVDGSS